MLFTIHFFRLRNFAGKRGNILGLNKNNVSRKQEYEWTFCGDEMKICGIFLFSKCKVHYLYVNKALFVNIFVNK